jgi:hypothetical protein
MIVQHEWRIIEPVKKAISKARETDLRTPLSGSKQSWPFEDHGGIVCPESPSVTRVIRHCMDRRSSEFDYGKVETPTTTPMPVKFGRLCLPGGNHHEVTCWVGATNDLLFATWGQPNLIDCFRQDGCSERVCQRILRFLRFEEVLRHGHGIVAEAVSYLFHSPSKLTSTRQRKS